jgi:hypothetical protein
MDAATYIQEHPEMIQQALNACLERARLCIKTAANILKSYKIYLIKCSNTFTCLILSFIFPWAHIETAIAQQLLEIELMLY